LSSVYGADGIYKEFSGYYLADEFRSIYPGMMIAIPDDNCVLFQQYKQAELVFLIKKHPKMQIYPGSRNILDGLKSQLQNIRTMQNIHRY